MKLIYQKIISLIALFGMSIIGLASADELSIDEVAGSYSQGGLILFPDQQVLLIGLGYVGKGTWEIKGENIHYSIEGEPTFTLYGRYLKELGDKKQMRLNLNNRQYEQHFVNFNPAKSDSRQKINCLSTSKNMDVAPSVNSLEFGLLRDSDVDYEIDGKIEFYFFDLPEQYNDFLVVNYPDSMLANWDVQSTWKDESLYSNQHSEGLKRAPLSSLREEDLNELRQIDISPETLEWGHDLFPYAEALTSDAIKYTTRIDDKSVTVYNDDVQHYTADYFEIPVKEVEVEEPDDSHKPLLENVCS